MKKATSRSSKIVIKKNISLSNRFNSYTSLFFILIICLNFFGLIYSIDTIASVKNNILRLEKQVEMFEDRISTQYTEDKENLANNYYRELSDKTDEAIDRILSIIGVLSTITTFFGVLLAFKAPKDIEKRMEENKNLLVKAEKASEDAKYQAEIIEALNIDYNGKLTNLKRVKNISQIIKKHPEKPDAYMHRGFLYDQMAQKLSGSRKKEFLYLAISDYEVARKLNVDISSYYNDMGIAYSRLQEYNKAILYYTKAIKKDPDDTAAYINRGDDYNSIGEYQRALDDFEKVLNLDPDCYEVYQARSCTYHGLWRKETNPEQRNAFIRLQISDLEHAIKINPEDDQPKRLLEKLINELAEKDLLSCFGFYTPPQFMNITTAKYDENLGDWQKENEKYIEAFEQYVKAILPYRNRYLISKEKDSKDAIIRIISKLYDIDSSIVIAEKDKFEETLTKFCSYTRVLPTLLYEEGDKDAAEKLLLLLLEYDCNDKSSALNLAFMKRRHETKYVEKTAIELLDLCSDQQSAIWCMNRALYYIDNNNYDEKWHIAIEILNNSKTDFDSAINWWSQTEIVGAKENNIAFLLFALSNKYHVMDSISLEERINIAKMDGYNIPDDLFQ